MKKILALVLISIFTISLTGLAVAGGDDNDGYTLSLKELIKQSRENIDQVDAELENRKTMKENEKRETAARLYFEKGNALYKQGKLKEAREQWQEALDLTSHPDMEKYIRQSDRKAKEQIRAQRTKKAPAAKKQEGAGTPKTVTKPKAETPEVQRGYVFQGSSLVVNDVKETKKTKIKKTEIKKSRPKAKTDSPAPKIAKPKVQKKEKQPPQRGYDIFVK